MGTLGSMMLLQNAEAIFSEIMPDTYSSNRSLPNLVMPVSDYRSCNAHQDAQ
jgi:hypothetical protein